MAEEAEIPHPSTFDLSVALASCLLQLAFPEHGIKLSLSSYILAALLKQTQYHAVFFGQFAAFLVFMEILTCFYRAFATLMLANTRAINDRMRTEINKIQVINKGIRSEILAMKNEMNKPEREKQCLEQDGDRMSEDGGECEGVDH